MAGANSTCKKCNGADISAYIDGMLDGDKMRLVSSHLRACPDCRRTYEGLSQTKDLLAGLSAPSQSRQADFWTQTYRQARLEAGKSGARRIAFFGDRHAIGYRWSIAAATAGVAVAAAFMALTPFSQPHVKLTPTMPSGPVLDISKVVSAHADYAAEQPLADDSRLSIVFSDTAQTDPQSTNGDSDDSAAPTPTNSVAPSDFSGDQAVQNAASALD